MNYNVKNYYVKFWSDYGFKISLDAYGNVMYIICDVRWFTIWHFSNVVEPISDKSSSNQKQVTKEMSVGVWLKLVRKKN